MSTILVTGGKGFLGTHIVNHLKKRGDTVRILARPSNSGQEVEADVIWGDVRDPEAVACAVEGVDAVIHLVSNFRRGGSDKAEAHSINVEGTKNVLHAAHKQGVSRFIHCSTIGVHGSVKEIPATEETPFNPGDLYQETKLLAEQYVWDYFHHTGMPITVVRPISMFGPGDTRMLKLFKMIKRGRFVMIGDGKPYFQPAYIDDVVNGFMLCLEKDEAVGEAFIIGGEEYVHLHDLVKRIAAEFNVSSPRLKVPLAPVLAAARLSEMVFVPLGVEPPLHQRRVSFFQNNRAFRIDKAKGLLGYESKISLQEGIRRTIRWYEDNNML